MRVYFVIRDTNPVKKDAAARQEIRSRMQFSEIEGATPDRKLQFDKVSADGSAWFGGIDLDPPALDILADRRKGEITPEDRLRAWVQEQVRAAVPAGERTRLSVQIVSASDDEMEAMIAAHEWLATNWEYVDDPVDNRAAR